MYFFVDVTHKTGLGRDNQLRLWPVTRRYEAMGDYVQFLRHKIIGTIELGGDETNSYLLASSFYGHGTFLAWNFVIASVVVAWLFPLIRGDRAGGDISISKTY